MKNKENIEDVPVITIDGPSGSGKGTVATAVANHLGFHYLDSGALYRILGYLAFSNGVDFADEPALVELASTMNVTFQGMDVLLDGDPVGDVIRTEQAGKHASMVSPIPAVRDTLLIWQRQQARYPGLIADGRDMGTVVFPGSPCKFFITASVQARAERRFNQLRDKGFDVNIAQLFTEISERDARDANRTVSPLKPAQDAVVLDTTEMSVKAVVDAVLTRIDSVIVQH